MSGWVRDASKCQGSNDGKVSIAQEGYLLPGGVDPVAVALHPEQYRGGNDGTTPLPARNSPHPSDPTALLDTYSVETDGGIATLVARYSSDRRFRFPVIPNANVSGYRWRASTAAYVFALPFAVQTVVRHYAPLPEGVQGPPTFVERKPWVYMTQNILVRAQKIGLSIRIPDSKILAALDLAYTLQNKIVEINGLLWLFEGGDVDEGGDSGDYRLQLGFMREPDITVDYNALPTTTRWPSVVGTIPHHTTAMVAKPAYHKTIILPPTTGDAQDLPTFQAIKATDFDPEGWAKLQGLVP